jgi:transcriptional regulator GlxA family with amidase domain
MLAQGDDTIAQVAYSVGFTAPSYFTKCYKDFFGEMPNELVKRKTGNN